MHRTSLSKYLGRLPFCPRPITNKNKAMRVIKRGHWLLAVVFALTVAITGLSMVRTAHRAAYWCSHRDEPIYGWMTVGYVAHSYHVPPQALYEALALPSQPPDKRCISKIARAQHHSAQDVIEVLRGAILQARPSHPPAPPKEAHSAYSDASRTGIPIEVGQRSDSKRTGFRLMSDGVPI